MLLMLNRGRLTEEEEEVAVERQRGKRPFVFGRRKKGVSLG